MIIIIAVAMILTSKSAIAHDSIRFDVKNYNVVKMIIQAADKVEVPRELLLAVCWNESSFNHQNPNLNRIDGQTPSYGVCQIKLETARFMDRVFKHKLLISEGSLKNVYINAFYAAKYLKYQLKRNKNNWQRAIDAYNKGHVVSTESEYVTKVMADYNHAVKVLPQIAIN